AASDGKCQQNIAQLALRVSRRAAPGSLGSEQIVHTRTHAAMHAGAHINQSLRSFDQRRQNVGREDIHSEEAWNSGFHLHPSLARTNARIVDYSVEAAELVDLVGKCFCPSDGREVPRDNSSGTGYRR